MTPYQAVIMACKMAGIEPRFLRTEESKRSKAASAVRRGVILGLRDRHTPYAEIAKALSLESAESARVIASRTQRNMRPGTLAEDIWVAIQNGKMPEAEEPEAFKTQYLKGSIVKLPAQAPISLGNVHRRGTVVTGSGSTFVRNHHTGELVWPNKATANAFRQIGGSAR